MNKLFKIDKIKILIIFIVVVLGIVGLKFLIEKKSSNLVLPVELNDEMRAQINERVANNLEMLKLFPNDYNVYLDLGNLEKQMGNAGQAIDYYKKAWEIIPANSTPWLNIGNIYIDLKDYKKAETAFLKGIEVNPTYHFTYFNLARLYRDYLPEKSDQIRVIYLEGLKNTNNDYQLLQPFTDYLIETKNYSEALEYLKVLLEKVPTINQQDVINRMNQVEDLLATPTN